MSQENHRPVSHINKDIKILIKFSKLNPSINKKRLTHYSKMKFILGMYENQILKIKQCNVLLSTGQKRKKKWSSQRILKECDKIQY